MEMERARFEQIRSNQRLHNELVNEQMFNESLVTFLLLYGYEQIQKPDSLGLTTMAFEHKENGLKIRVLKYRGDQGNYVYQVDFFINLQTPNEDGSTESRISAGIVKKKAQLHDYIIECASSIEKDLQ